MRNTIIRKWTSDWNKLYEEEARRLKDIFQEELIQIYHIGSTAIPTIGYAKPIIDIVIGLSNIDKTVLYDEKMCQLGYEVRGENGITDRRYYTKGGHNRSHHVHIYRAGHENINKHLQFKYYLMNHPEQARKYGQLKIELATKFPDDTSSYQQAKESFVTGLMEEAQEWSIIKKSYGYITRMTEAETQILVFQHPVKKAGIQIPKGTVKHRELPVDAVKREMEEETGLSNFPDIHYLIDDFWENDDGVIHHRYFYRLNIDETQDEWNYEPTGGGAEDGKVFRFFWITPDDGKLLIRGHADYFPLISLKKHNLG